MYHECGTRRTWYSASRTPRSWRRRFRARKTQIIAHELAAIAAALWNFTPHLRGKVVRFYTDNQSALAMILKGSARRAGLNDLVGRIWLDAADLEIEWRFVPSRANIADGPSRVEFGIVQDMGGEWVQTAWPELPEV